MEHFVKTCYRYIRLLERYVSLEGMVLVCMLLSVVLGRFQDGGRYDGYLVGVGNLLDKLGLNDCCLLESTFLGKRFRRC